MLFIQSCQSTKKWKTVTKHKTLKDKKKESSANEQAHNTGALFCLNCFSFFAIRKTFLRCHHRSKSSGQGVHCTTKVNVVCSQPTLPLRRGNHLWSKLCSCTNFTKPVWVNKFSQNTLYYRFIRTFLQIEKVELLCLRTSRKHTDTSMSKTARFVLYKKNISVISNNKKRVCVVVVLGKRHHHTSLCEWRGEPAG